MAEFPAGEMVDSMCQTVNFRAIVAGKTVVCCITFEALDDNFGARGNHVPTFQANRGILESVAENLIENNRFETDSRIVIKSADVR